MIGLAFRLPPVGLALSYYGFPFRNPAYAKTNVARPALDVALGHGLGYWRALAAHDLATFVVVASAALAGLWSGRRCGALTALSAGVLLNCGYVTAVGGDFMLGRFLSYAYLLSCFRLWFWLRDALGADSRRRVRAGVLLGALMLVVFWACLARTPLSAAWHPEPVGDHAGVMDERGHYLRATLAWYWERERGPFFPLTPEAEQGYRFARGANRTLVVAALGQAGYQARPDQVVLDYFGLASPLLARIDGVSSSRVGHVCRAFPAGFVGAWEEGEGAVVDDAVRDYHRRLALVTSSADLWSPSRWREICRLNVLERKLAADYSADDRLLGCDRLVTTG